jgi:hypothetical protein
MRATFGDLAGPLLVHLALALWRSHPFGNGEVDFGEFYGPLDHSYQIGIDPE